MRHTHPLAYENGLKLQNHILHDKYIVPVLHITPAMMFDMKPYLQDIQGVHDVFPTQHTHENGRWNIIVNKDTFHTTRTAIQQALPLFTTKVAADAMPQDKQHFTDLPIIPIRNSNRPTNDPFLTASIESFSSIDTLSFTTNQVPKTGTAYGSKRWSEIVQPAATPLPTGPPKATPLATVTAQPSFDNAKLFEQLDAQKQEIQGMQAEIVKLEKLVLLLTQKLESVVSHIDAPNTATEKAKHNNSEVVNTPPQQHSTKRQKPTTGTPTTLEDFCTSGGFPVSPATQALPSHAQPDNTSQRMHKQPASSTATDSPLSQSDRGTKFFGTKLITQYFGRSKAVVTN